MALVSADLLAVSSLRATNNTVNTLWDYPTNDTLATVAGDGYFDAANELLQTNDVIQVRGDLDGTPALQNYLVVNDGAGDIALTEMKIA